MPITKMRFRVVSKFKDYYANPLPHGKDNTSEETGTILQAGFHMISTIAIIAAIAAKIVQRS